MDQSQFWHRSAWKWGLFLVLLGCSAFLLVWKPAPRPVKVELLPFADLPPAWNGSYPYLVISPLDLETDPVKFRSSILLVQPTVRHDSPINEFEVDLHSGMFVLRQTDLFVSDVMPLSLTRTYRGWDFESRARAFGAGTNHSYDICPTGSRFPYTYMDLNWRMAGKSIFCGFRREPDMRMRSSGMVRRPLSFTERRSPGMATAGL